MTNSELDVFAETLQRYSGGWGQAYATLLRRSDPVRKQRLLDAFPELEETYGPDSIFFRDTKQQIQEAEQAFRISLAPTPQ